MLSRPATTRTWEYPGGKPTMHKPPMNGQETAAKGWTNEEQKYDSNAIYESTTQSGNVW